MGVLTDFFIGDNELAKHLEGTSSLPQEIKLQSKGVLDLYVGYLYQIAVGKEVSFDPELGFETINIFDEGERVTIKIPEKIVGLLSSASEVDRDAWAIEWAKLEELQWPEEIAIRFVSDLQNLFKKSIFLKKSVYLWMCV